MNKICKYKFLNVKNARQSKEYRIWKSMKIRCSKNTKSHQKYKNKKIYVCERWINDFKAFYNDMGKIPEGNYSIYRIDNNGNYEPNNCRWANQSTQCKNRGSFNNIYTFDNKTMVLKDWAKFLNLKYTTLHTRIFKNKIPFEEALYNVVSFTDFIHNKYNINPNCFADRKRRGWSIDRILNTPCISKTKKNK